MENPDAVDFLRAASLWARMKNMSRAAAVLQVGLQVHPKDITLGRSLAELTDAKEAFQCATEVSVAASER
jgi:hypothetical protein